MKKLKISQMINRGMTHWIVAFLFVLTSCSSKTEVATQDQTTEQTASANKYEISSSQFKSSEMALGEMETKPFHEVVKANGMMDVPPENHASVSSYFGGTVKDIRLLPGQKVKRGQLLFVLENPEYVVLQQEYLSAKGQLTFLESDYERQKNLAQDNVTSQKNYLKAESEYTVTKVKLASFGKQLTLMNIDPRSLTVENIQTTINITSPINGFVTEVNVTQGAFLNSSQVAVSIVNTTHMHLELNIFEKDLAKVKVGQAIQFAIQEDVSNQYDASVHLVNKTVDAENRTIRIHGHLADESMASNFNPGMYVEADIFTTSKSSAALPHDAIVEAEDKYYVLVLESSSTEGSVFEKREVKVGASYGGYIEILNGSDFKTDARFVVKGAFNLITD
jgi:cobalt-zinc-cadmium efflux system membrane fusion protein